MAMKLNNQDKKDLDKYKKFLAIKTAQLIVWSRLGLKISTACKLPTSSNDWFNLACEDLPDILILTKRALSTDATTEGFPICVEFWLEAPESKRLFLESWCLTMIPDQCDSSVAINTVYNRMGMLLKSLLTVTRVVPTYRISRIQGETYFISYDIYRQRKTLLYELGKDYKDLTIGQIATPTGTIKLSVAFRTYMNITEKMGPDNSIMLISDHFETNLSPIYNERTKLFVNNTLKVGAFAENKLNVVDEENEIPFGNLLIEKKNLKKNPINLSPLKIEKVTEEISEDSNGNTKEVVEKSGFTMTPTNDDFIMVDLKPPFASTNINAELGFIYKEWQTAPPLKTFSDVQPFSEQVHDLTRQLESFELNMQTYNKALKTYCQFSNNN